jgi:hypothetical protein
MTRKEEATTDFIRASLGTARTRSLYAPHGGAFAIRDNTYGGLGALRRVERVLALGAGLS